MATNRTFTMIKPDGVENGHIGGILNMITEGGFKIVSLKLTQLTVADEDFRNLIGATNPADAAEGTIRKKYATSIGENAVHGSDSDENAAIESAFHFAGREQF